MAVLFKLKSSNVTSFKEMGSSPAKQKIDPTAKPLGDQYKKDQFKKMVSKDDKGVIDKATRQLSKKAVKKGIGKTILKGAGKVAKFAAKRLGPVGAAITAYEAYNLAGKPTPKKVAKATIKGLKKRTEKETETGYSNPGVRKI